jgi:hypothetical protein
MEPHGQQRERMARYPLLDALRERRSRRFGLGMRIPDGPFQYTSCHTPQSLDEADEAALAFAACGLTGYALADLAYGPGQGGQMLAGLVGRTISSADAINTVSLIVTNDTATYLLKRPQDFAASEIPELIALARSGALTDLYRRSRVRIADGRCSPPVEPGFNFNINKWALYAPGGSYLIPINELTGLYINALLEAFDETMALFVVDERNLFRPAGLGPFAASRGGHLRDGAGGGRLVTVQALEASLMEAAAIEQGMLLQNVGLMAQALGLGGYPNFAPHPYSWFQALGFRLLSMPASLFLGAPRWASALAGLLGRDPLVFVPVGLERDGQPLLRAYCPPYYPSMEAAVHAVVERKFGVEGVFRGAAAQASGWRDPVQAASNIPAPSARAVAATVAYCSYLYRRYGRFPAYAAPFRTVMGYQATRVDVEFYDRFYRPEAVSETQRAAWRAQGSARVSADRTEAEVTG